MEQIIDNSREYEHVAIEHDPMFQHVVTATARVKEFIRETGAILYGGSAIDFALRLKGDKIYPDDMLIVADLDFFSTNSVEDAYKLTDILYNMGFEEARAINAVHIGTMRVDIGDNHFIADIS